MSAVVTSGPSQGWYPDPNSLALRWWDGAGWTDFVTDPPGAGPRAASAAGAEVPFVATVAGAAPPEASAIVRAAPPPAALGGRDAFRSALETARAARGALVGTAVVAEAWSGAVGRRRVAPEPRFARPMIVPPRPPARPAPAVPAAAVLPAKPIDLDAVSIGEATGPPGEGARSRRRRGGRRRRGSQNIAPEQLAALEAAVIDEPAAAGERAADEVLAAVAQASDEGVEALDAPPVAAPDAPAPVAPSRRRRLVVGAAATLVAAGAGVGGTLAVLGHGSAQHQRDAERSARRAIPAVDMACVRQWNQTTTVEAAQLRVTLGQFSGALARVQRVAPLGGTLVKDNSCALTVYDPGDDTHATFLAGVQGSDAFMDVTSYPRAAKYGWPKTETEANVRVEPDGSIRAIAG